MSPRYPSCQVGYLDITSDIDVLAVMKIILQNNWWLNQIVFPLKPCFSLCFKRRGFVNNRMTLGFFSSQRPAWVFPSRMKLNFNLVDHRLLVCQA
jgi:hypothetical protein